MLERISWAGWPGNLSGGFRAQGPSPGGARPSATSSNRRNRRICRTPSNKRTGLGAPAPVTSTENVAEFEAALKRFVDELQPRGIVEETLVFQAAATAWRLRRLPYLESALAETLLHSNFARKELEFLSRHEERLNRAYRQIVQDLKSRHQLPSPGRARTAESRPAASPGAGPPESQGDYSYQAAAAPPSPAPGGASPPA